MTVRLADLLVPYGQQAVHLSLALSRVCLNQCEWLEPGLLR